jgi:flagellar basal-body rod protein FlgB
MVCPDFTGREQVEPASVGIFDLAERRLAWLDRRAAVLAGNIANAATPGWQARDLKPFSAALDAAGVTPLRTHPMHLAGTASDDPAARALSGESAPDGNTVRVDVELTKVADTETAQTLVSGLWKSYVGLFRTALGK